MAQPSLGFVILFLLFSLIFFSNTYKLWFKTDEYYQSIYNSLTRQPSLYPFKDFFLKWMENQERWILRQKIFSVIGTLAVLVADTLVIMAFMAGDRLTLFLVVTFSVKRWNLSHYIQT